MFDMVNKFMLNGDNITLVCWFPLYQNKHSKVFLNWLICKRRRKLQHLKDARFERYLELLKELDLEPLDHPHSAKNKYKMRRRTTRQ